MKKEAKSVSDDPSAAVISAAKRTLANGQAASLNVWFEWRISS
jgi:hypothetical protein